MERCQQRTFAALFYLGTSVFKPIIRDWILLEQERGNNYLQGIEISSLGFHHLLVCTTCTAVSLILLRRLLRSLAWVPSPMLWWEDESGLTHWLWKDS